MFLSHPKSVPTLAALLLCLSANAFSQTRPNGGWSGVVRSATSAVVLDIALKPKSAHLHFKDPKSCQIDASFFDKEKDGDHYRFTLASSSGGFCDKLGPGELILGTSSPAEAPVSFKQNGAVWTGTLKPDAAAH